MHLFLIGISYTNRKAATYISSSSYLIGEQQDFLFDNFTVAEAAAKCILWIKCFENSRNLTGRNWHFSLFWTKVVTLFKKDLRLFSWNFPNIQNSFTREQIKIFSGWESQILRMTTTAILFLRKLEYLTTKQIVEYDQCVKGKSTELSELSWNLLSSEKMNGHNNINYASTNFQLVSILKSSWLNLSMYQSSWHAKTQWFFSLEYIS